MLCDRRKGISKRMDGKIRITGNDIFNFIRMLAKFQLDIAYCVILSGKGDTFFHAVDKASLESLLVSCAQVKVGHVGIQVGLPLGMEGICVNSGADIVEFHFCRISDIDAVNLYGGEQ